MTSRASGSSFFKRFAVETGCAASPVQARISVGVVMRDTAFSLGKSVLAAPRSTVGSRSSGTVGVVEGASDSAGGTGAVWLAWKTPRPSFSMSAAFAR